MLPNNNYDVYFIPFRSRILEALVQASKRAVQ